MLKMLAGTMVALASVGLLLLGGCTTSAVRDAGTTNDEAAAPSASPSTSSESAPELDGHFDLSEFPQAL